VALHQVKHNGIAPEVVCVGHAIVDLVNFVAVEELAANGLRPGTMNLIDLAEATRLTSAFPGAQLVSGGSAANTAAGVASFGGAPLFVGAVGDDPLGAGYAADLEVAGVSCVLGEPAGEPGAVTGQCFVLVTPGADRTMATYLGLAGTLTAAAMAQAPIHSTRIIYFEGYLYDAPARAALEHGVEIAKSVGTPVALTLSDPFLAERHNEALSRLVESTVDILFANETELISLTGAADVHAAIASIARPDLTAFVTRGAEGALAVTGDAVEEVPAFPVERVVDTTGAGDLFAAGALFGLVRGASAAHAARLGALAAAEIISHAGARTERSLRELAHLHGLDLELEVGPDVGREFGLDLGQRA
jgi:sugar/nucleoside kinase (ribokinase family)